MRRALRLPLVPALLLLAVLCPPRGWATPAPLGASFALTDVLVDYDPVNHNLSAQAAPVGGLPALPLLNNGKYRETAAGDFAVTLNLPPLTQQNYWLLTYAVSFDGVPFLNGQDIEGPISVMQAYDKAFGLVPKGLQSIVKNLLNALVTQPQHATLGLLDWSYNRDPADDMTGTFAFGSTLNIAKILGTDFDLPPGESTFGLSVSAYVFDVPEPAAALILAPAVLGLVLLRRRAPRRV